MIRDYGTGTEGARCNRWATVAGGVVTNWSSYDPSVQTGSTSDENQVRYGRDAYSQSGGWDSLSCPITSIYNQSGFGFDGNNGPVTPAANTPFYLGKFTHYNNQVFSTDDGDNNANPFVYVDPSL